jgi:hypothetical protein
MSEPTKPGYYWAKFQHYLDWKIAKVVSVNIHGIVLMVGSETIYPLSDFTFGPEVIKPEGLE